MISRTTLTQFISIAIIAAATALALDLNCPGNDTLLHVKYNLTEDMWNTMRSSDGYIAFFLNIVPQQQLISPDNITYILYDNFTDLVDFEKCLPRDECSEVVVAGLPTDAYQISFGDEHVDIGAEFRYFGKNPVTYTEVGTCINDTPTCEATKALVEVQYWSGKVGYRQSAFLIEDKNSDVVMKGGPTRSLSLNSTYACVPRNNSSCYTFLIGSTFVWDPSWPLQSYSLVYDGKLLRKSDSFQFDSVQFGDDCQPRCNQNNESLVELFLYDQGDGVGRYEYEWDLKFVTDDSSDPSSTSGVVPIGPDESPLYHKTMCVSKDSCSSFFISGSSGPTEQMANPIYSLALDNTIYREISWYPGWLGDSSNQTTNMGSCTVGGLCDEQTQDLFDLELHTPAGYKLDGRSSAMIPFGNITWNFDYTDVDKRAYSGALLSASQYICTSYNTDSRYRMVECVPRGGCDFSFNIAANSAVETYTVKKNGAQLGDTQEVEGLINDEFNDPVLEKLSMTPFGENCFLSGGAIAGIVVACLVVLSALIGAIMVCLKRHEGRQNQCDEEDPLKENLL